MPILEAEEAKALKAVIMELGTKAARQTILGIIEILRDNPSVKTQSVIDLIDISRKWPRDED